MTSRTCHRLRKPRQRPFFAAALPHARHCQKLPGLREAHPEPGDADQLDPLLEAQASSEIENIVTTTDRPFRYASDVAGHDPATREALRYRSAMYRGFEMLKRRPVSTAMAVEVCRTIKGVDLDIRNTPGTALMNDATDQAIYTPPEGEDVLRSKLANWERHIHEFEEIDPLILLAVMHYQFEAIRPFVDGTGRTGRVLNRLYLVDKGLLDIPRPLSQSAHHPEQAAVLPVSA